MLFKYMILGISGSPRKKATEYVLREGLKMLEERGLRTEFFTVRGKTIGFCQHCDFCLKNKRCRIEDDMYQIFPLLKSASGIIIATPVYYGGVSAQIKAVMDRCRSLVAADPHFFAGKLGMAIAVGGDRVGGQEPAIHQIMDFYIINGVTPVGGGSFGANLGATFWSHDTLDGVKNDEEGFRTLRKTIKRFNQKLEGFEG
ncbi:MAG: flavodoxin family protein [Archaeoglobaceae archaeon]